MKIKESEIYLNIDGKKYKGTTLKALNYYLEYYMLTVPFKNIDVQNGVRISVEVEDVFNKVAKRKIVGFCYQMNNLFKVYSEEKNFVVTMVFATVHTPNGG
ncbi:arylamine N-acetyltransferase (plasmid) [Mammaliicoccus sciuri]